MHRILFACLLLSPLFSLGQITPRENASLNYRLVPFSFSSPNSGIVEIAVGRFEHMDSFEKRISISKQVSDGHVIIEVPAFGTEYTWRTSLDRKLKLHHFQTLPYGDADTSKARLRIITNSGKHNEYFVFIDKSFTLYDINGSPIWFIPHVNITDASKGGIRDIKLTAQGTVTYICGSRIAEIDYDGNEIWHGPDDGRVSGDSTELYHHEFTRLSTGHYMVLGTESIAFPLPQYHPEIGGDSTPGIVRQNGAYLQTLEFGTVIEYDQKGRVAWSWKSSGYFRNSEMFNHYRADGTLPFIDVHENAFCFDEQKKVIYVGFKNVSRILKVAYPSGKVLADYGAKNMEGAATKCSSDFCGQHSIRLTHSGNFLIFNNNSSSFSNLPQIVQLQEGEGSQLTKTWSYNCTLDGIQNQDIEALRMKNERIRRSYPPAKLMDVSMQLSPGGNVTELPEHSFFVSMGGPFGKLSIINEQGNTLWSAILEFKIFNGAPWTSQATYRAEVINKNELLRFIGHSQ